MNIFVLSTNPQTCAEYHCDAHVRKMILEYAQLMCTAHYVLDGATEINSGHRFGKIQLYKPTHINHPCAVWTRTCTGNYLWLWDLWNHLCTEYYYRWGKIHATWSKFGFTGALRVFPNTMKRKAIQPFVPCVPEDLKNLFVTSAYREYYRREKRHLAKWTNRPIPEWYK